MVDTFELSTKRIHRWRRVDSKNCPRKTDSRDEELTLEICHSKLQDIIYSHLIIITRTKTVYK